MDVDILSRIQFAFPLTILQFLLYVGFMFAILLYAILDGFDLGVGCLHPFAKSDEERTLSINIISPVWYGNAAWIVIACAVLFGAFPKAFSVLAPSLYIPLAGMLFGFAVRALAVAFHGKTWKAFWDWSFFGASLLLAIMLGVILGNLIQGLPINDSGVIAGGVTELLTFYPLLIVGFSVVTFSMHGSLFLLIKTEGSFQDRICNLSKKLIDLFLIFWLFSCAATFISQPHMIEPFSNYPPLLVFPALSLASIFGIRYMVNHHAYKLAFTLSCGSIGLLFLNFLIGTFPYIAYSSINPEANGLTFMNSSASEESLILMVVIAVCSLPLILFYAWYVYKAFKGKVKLDKMSY